MPTEERNDALKRKIKIAIERYQFAVDCLGTGKRIVDLGCFVEGTKIKTKYNVEKNIEDINIGDYVMTHLGNFRQVINIHKLKTNKIIKIKSLYGYNIECTDNHLILIVDKNEVRCNHDKKQFCNTTVSGDCGNCNKEKPFRPKYIEGKKLMIGDFLCVPKNRYVNITDNNYDLATLLGYYLAEGNVIYSHKPKVCGLLFSLHINENYIFEEIKKSAERLGCTNVIKRVFLKRVNSMSVYIYGKKLAELILKLGSKYSLSKHIHSSIFFWRPEDKIQLLRCWFNGDGHHQIVNKKGETLSGKTISYNLANDLRELFKSLNIICGFSIEHPVNSNIIYKLILSGSDIDKFDNRKFEYSSKRRYRQDDFYFYIPIISIMEINKNQVVYDLTVNEDNSYTANGIAVHNCGMGYGSYLLSLSGNSVVGIDNSSQTVEYAKINYPGEYEIGDLENMVLGDFDAGVCLEVLCHLIDPQGFIDKIKMNELVISAPIDPDPNDGYYYRLHNLSEIQFREILKDWHIVSEFRQKKYLTIYCKQI